jgi:hypothetical protein
MADLVSEIISQGALDQLELANAQLELAVKNVNNVATAAKGIVIDFKGAGNIGELNAAMAKQAENIQTITEATKKYEAAVDKKQRAIEIAERNELLGIQKVIAEREKAAKQADLDAETVRKNAEREEKALAKLNNAYEQLKVQYKKAADEAKKLGAEFGVTDARATAAAGSAMKLYNSLLAVEKSVGQAQRQVGQYNTAAVAMSQILREMPAFTYSAATGFLAMSNNIPILVDEIAKLKTANDALKASGGTAIPIWKTLMSSITSPVGLITIATTAITFLAAKTDIFKSSVDEAGNSVKRFEESLKSLNKNIQDLGVNISTGIENETQKAKLLVDVYNDTNTNIHGKIAAYRELSSMFPNVLTAMSEEEKASGKLSKAHQNQIKIINDVIKAKVHLDEISKTITTATGTKEDTKKLMADMEKEMSEQSKSAVQRAIKAQGDRLTHINVVDPAQGVDEEQVNKYLDYRDQEMHIERQISKLKEIQYKYAVKYMNTQVETDKKGKEKKVKDTTAKSESDLLRTEYELNKQRTEQNAAMLKEIADNEKNTLNQRLDAYMEYQSELFQAAVLERDYIVKQEQAKQAEIREKLKTAKGQEIENLNDQLIASNLRITMAAEKTAGEFIDIEKKQAEGRLAIIESANEKFIDAQKDLFVKLSTNEEFLYLNEIELLKGSLDKKEITRREYNKRLTELQKKQHIAFLQAEKEFIEKVLANESLTPENRAKYEEKLKNVIAAMAKGEKAPEIKNRKGRPTDRIAKLFIPEDMPEQEQYLEEFYNRTVALANQAADAIIEAKNRQYEAENARLDEQARKIEANYTEQSRLIDATVKDETERYNQQQKLLAQTEAQQSTIEDRKREVARRQAAAQKTAAIAAIIQNTAIAMAGALQYGPGAPVIMALIAAAGAVQLAAAANTPIPAYKEGTTYHKGGKFIAGDGGEKELIIAPNKTPYWSNSISTLYDEAEGTKVIPKSAMQYAMANTTSNVGNISAAYDARNSAIIAETIGSIVSREFDKTGRKLATVIVNSQPKQHQTESVADELRKMRNLQGL